MPRQQTLAEWVASHSTADPNHLAEYLSSMKAHGERAEDRFTEQFSGWLVKFALAVDKNSIRTQAWEKLKSKCDVLLLLQHLYLFTYFGKTSADVLQDAFRFLKAGIDGLIPKYSKTCKDTSELFDDPKLGLITVLSKQIRPLFEEPMRLLRIAEQELLAMRQWAEQMGSHKTDAHDLDLYAMATSVRAATGQYHFPELAKLIEAARIAHGGRDEPVDEGVMKRRVERYAKRMNLDPQRSFVRKES